MRACLFSDGALSQQTAPRVQAADLRPHDPVPCPLSSPSRAQAFLILTLMLVLSWARRGDTSAASFIFSIREKKD